MRSSLSAATVAAAFSVFILFASFTTAFAFPRPVSTLSSNGGDDEEDCGVSLTEIDPLAFGALYISNSAGTLVITPNSTRSSTGGVFAFTSPNFDFNAAEVAIRYSSSDDKSKNKSQHQQEELADQFSIELPNSATLMRSGGYGTMVVNHFTTKLTKSGVEDRCTIGGTLNVVANQNPGLYSGEFEVRIDFE